MDGVEEARYLELWREQGRRDHWRDLVGWLFVPGKKDDLGLLGRGMRGHEGYRLPSYDGYLAACSRGWRSVDIHRLHRMLRQVKDHLHAARQAQEPRCRQLARDNYYAEDRYQRTAILAWRGHASSRGNSSYLTWLMRIADREAARLGAQRELLARREIRLDPRYADEQLPAESQTDGEHPGAGWLRIALADALVLGAISAAEQQVMAERHTHPDESWPDIAARLAMTPTVCAVAHSRAVPKLRVFLFTSRPALVGGDAAIAEAFAQARQDRSVPLTELEAEAFEQLVIRRRPGYRRRGQPGGRSAARAPRWPRACPCPEVRPWPGGTGRAQGRHSFADNGQGFAAAARVRFARGGSRQTCNGRRGGHAYTGDR